MGGDTRETTTTARLEAAPVRRWSTSDLFVLAAISAVAAAVRLFGVELWSLGPAEAVTWRAVTCPLDGSEHAFSSSPQVGYPLYFLMLRELLEQGLLPGNTEGWLRLPSAFAGGLVTPLVALLARPLLGRATGTLAALTVAVHPACVAASQTASPEVFASAVALLAGVLAMRGWLVLGCLAVVVAGACHPLGWPAAAGLVLATRPPRWLAEPQRGWLLVLALASAPVLAELCAGPVWTGVMLAVAAVWLRLPRARGLVLAALLPLATAGLWWWWTPAVDRAACVVATPVVAMLAAWSCVQFARVVAPGLGLSRAVARLVAAAPTVVLLGELLTATFLYFAVYDGSRSAWRSARTAVAAARAPGRDLVVVAGAGAGVMRTYLRPNHWRDMAQDPHPGVVVEHLAYTRAAREEQARRDGVLFVLLPSELHALGDALGDLVVVDLWSGSKADGDASLYVMRRRSGD